MTERPAPIPAWTRAIMAHGIDEARAAAALACDRGVPLCLVSAPGAGGYAGGGWWRALTDRLAQEFPGLTVTSVLDCGDGPGYVLAALRAGVRDVAYEGPDDVAAKLQAIAEALGGRLWRTVPPACDPRRHRNPAAAMARWLDVPDPIGEEPQ